MNQKMVESALRQSNWLQEMEVEGGRLHPSQHLKRFKANTLLIKNRACVIKISKKNYRIIEYTLI